MDVDLIITRVLLFDDHASSRVVVVHPPKTLSSSSTSSPPPSATAATPGTDDKSAGMKRESIDSSNAMDGNKINAESEDAGTSVVAEKTMAIGKDPTLEPTAKKKENPNSDTNYNNGKKLSVANQTAESSSVSMQGAPTSDAVPAEPDKIVEASNKIQERCNVDTENPIQQDTANETVISPTTTVAKPAIPLDTTNDTTNHNTDIRLANARISVRRDASARGTITFPKSGFVHLPNGDCGDGIVNPYPDTVDNKYWAQRHRLFGRFEGGIQLDREGWFSVTPEAIANHIAQKMTQHANRQGMTILDAFVGVGGNAIAFAKRDEVSLVICVDTDRKRLCMAANNCKVYEIPKEKILFVCADAVDVLQSYHNGKRVDVTDNTAPKDADTPSHVENDGTIPVDQHGYMFVAINELPYKLDAVFLSPPWGGTEYSNQRHFDLDSIKINDETNGDDLLRLAVQSLPKENTNLAYFLPRNTNGWQVGQSAYRAGLKRIVMEQNYLNFKLKTITLYAGTTSDEDT